MWCRWIYSAIEKSTNIKVKFCRPHIQLQKNTVQRSNGPEIYPHVPLLLPTVAKEFEFEREGAGRTLKSGHWTLLLQKMRNHILIDQAPWHIPFIGHRRSMHFSTCFWILRWSMTPWLSMDATWSKQTSINFLDHAWVCWFTFTFHIYYIHH